MWEFFQITHLFFLQCLVAPIPHLHIFHRPIKSLCCCFIDMWFPCRNLLFAPRLRRRPPPGPPRHIPSRFWSGELFPLGWSSLGGAVSLTLGLRSGASWDDIGIKCSAWSFVSTHLKQLASLHAFLSVIHALHACMHVFGAMHACIWEQALIHERAPLLLNAHVLTLSLISLLAPYFPFCDKSKWENNTTSSSQWPTNVIILFLILQVSNLLLIIL